MTAGPGAGIGDLVALARDRSPEARRRLAGHLSHLYSAAEPLSGRERELVDDILHQLLRDAEADVRRLLAERLSEEPSAPRALIVALANDEISVAEQVIRRSPFLADADLVAIAQRRSLGHRLAIAHRNAIGEAVSDVLVAKNEAAVLLALLENHGARLSSRAVTQLCRRARRFSKLREPLLLRPEITASLAVEIYWLVSLELRRLILERFDIPAPTLDEALERTLEELARAAHARERATREQRELVIRLAEAGRITPQLLIKVLRLGQTALFQLLLARVSDLDVQAVRVMTAQPGGKALAVLCKAQDIEKTNFASIFLLGRRARPGEQIVDPRELSRVLALYDRLDADDCRAVLEELRLDPGYLRCFCTPADFRYDA